MGHIPVNLLLGAQQTLQQTGLIPVINTMAKTSSSNPAAAETVRRSTRTKTAEQGGEDLVAETVRRSTRTKTAEQGGGGGFVAVPPGNRSLRKAPPETMPTLVALQPPPALPPILGPPPPYPRRTNRTPSLNPPAILVIHTQAIHPQQAPLGDAVSPIVDGDDGSSSVVGVAVGGGTDLLSGSYHDRSDSDGFSEVLVDDDDDYSDFSEDDDKKQEASNPNCLDYSTDEDDEDNYIFDPDLEEFELVDFSDPNKGSKKIRGRPRGNIGGPQPPDYSTMNPVEKKWRRMNLFGKGGDGVPNSGGQG